MKIKSTSNWRQNALLGCVLSFFVSVADARPALLRTLRGHSGEVNTLSFSPVGRTLASGGEDRTLRFWDVKSGVLRHTIKMQYEVSSFSSSSNGSMMAVAQGDKVQLWHSWPPRLLRVLALPVATKQSAVNTTVAISRDGKTVAASTGYASTEQAAGTTALWDARTGKLLRSWRQKDAEVTQVKFSPDGRTLATALISSDSFGGGVRLWDVASGKLKKTLIDDRGGEEILLNEVAFTADGKSLAMAGGYFEGPGRVSVWNVASGRFKWGRTFGDWSTALAFSPDGKTLAAGTVYDTEYSRKHTKPGGDIKLFEVRTGNWKRSLKRHRDGVNTVAFSPDGKLLASGSDDKTIKLWRLK